jgi:hypothetical protein
MAEIDHRQPGQDPLCSCFIAPGKYLVVDTELGMDGNFAEVSLLSCSLCSQKWLRYFYEVEAFTASGRWYLGAITKGQASHLMAENAKSILEGLSWYFYGGSYYGGKSGRTSGRIWLNP